MSNRLSSQLLLVAACGALIAGCGSSSKSSSGDSGTSSPSSSSTPSGPAIAEAVAACKATVEAQSSISATVRSKLNSICDEAGAGNQAAVKKATAEVCIEVVKESVPAADQQAAEANCPKP
jgi:hypothetical protein